MIMFVLRNSYVVSCAAFWRTMTAKAKIIFCIIMVFMRQRAEWPGTPVKSSIMTQSAVSITVPVPEPMAKLTSA